MFFAKKPKKIAFDDAKRVLDALLSEVGEQHWASQVGRSSSSSFRGLLGGMGSLNDVIICRQNSHKVTDEDDPRANALLTAMIGVCYEASSRGPLLASDAARLCVGEGIVLSGSRCRQCGHSFMGSRSLLSHLATVRLASVMADSSASDWPVGSLLAYWHTRESDQAVAALADRLRSAGIEYSPGDGWMRPCRACHSEDTCIYRWRITDTSIYPSDDNLTIRV